MARRVNGCERPFSHDQVAAWVGQLFLMLYFMIVAFGLLNAPSSNRAEILGVSAGLWCVFVVSAGGCWAWCQLADPAVKPSHPAPRLFGILKATPHEDHYCARCKKAVPGIDHHCRWLGTCVGSRTYFAFYLLTLFAFFVYAWQIIVYALMMSTWRTPEVRKKAFDVFGNDYSLYVVAGVGIATCVPVATFYGLLFGFHSYLQYRNMTTYEWFLENAAQKREARLRAKQRQQKEHEQPPKPAAAPNALQSPKAQSETEDKDEEMNFPTSPSFSKSKASSRDDLKPDPVARGLDLDDARDEETGINIV